MVICQSCQQVLPPGRADQRFCSGRYQTRHYQAQKDPQQADKQWRRRLYLEYPVFFRPSDDYQTHSVVDGRCWIPTRYWNNQLEGLNQLHVLAYILTDFIDAQGNPGRTDHSENGGQYDVDDWAGILLSKLDEMQLNLDCLSRSKGQLGLLLRAHWSALETGLKTLRVHMQRFALSHQAGEPYVVDWPPAFQAHLREWGLELNLLWLDLERRTR